MKKNMTTEWQNEKSVLSIEFAADIDIAGSEAQAKLL